MVRSVRVLSSVGWEKRRRTRRQRTDGYQSRDLLLKELGYSSYSEYLRSDEWKSLRASVLARRKWCLVCDRIATELHHFSYDAPVMLGMCHDLLIPLCRKCHIDVEIDGSGEKNQLIESQRILLSYLSLVGKTSAVSTIKNAYEISRNQSVSADVISNRRLESDRINAQLRSDRKDRRKARRHEEKQARRIAAGAKDKSITGDWSVETGPKKSV